jgi:phosphoribosylformylglycinamidine synthase
LDSQDALLGLGGSAYLHCVHGRKTGTPPRCDLEKEKELHLTLRALIYSGVVKSAHDCSEGGLAVALAESCISQQLARETPRLIGAQVDLSEVAGLKPAAAEIPGGAISASEGAAAPVIRLDALLFGESQGRILISTAPLDAAKVLERAKLLGTMATLIGRVGGEELAVRTSGGDHVWSVKELYELWWHSIAKTMQA